MSNAPSPPQDGRILKLAGGCNFRDLGGYQTAAGQKLAKGRVFRSGALAHLTPEDQALIASLGLRLILDLRATPERAARPSRLPASSPVEIWARDHAGSTGNLLEALARPGNTAAHSHNIMVKVYRSLAYEQAESYRELFLRLADGQTPLLFHCAVGKDRTGIAAALLLDVLGVARETVIEDYVLTNLCFDQNLSAIMHEAAILSRIDRSVWAPMMRAETAYLVAFFETIQDKHGSSEGFLREVLELPADIISRLRASLLEDS